MNEEEVKRARQNFEEFHQKYPSLLITCLPPNILAQCDDCEPNAAQEHHGRPYEGPYGHGHHGLAHCHVVGEPCDQGTCGELVRLLE